MLLSVNVFAVRGDDVEDWRGTEFFETKIRPVLVKHCYECHSADSDDLQGKLRVDLRAGMLQGGETGPAVVPKNIDKSLLISALEYRDFEMPPDGKLSEEVIEDFRKWIKMGAPDPRDGEMAVATPAAVASKKPATELWSLRPIANPQPPVVKQADWPRSQVDRFVLAELEARDLKPVADAAPEQMLRRVYFDLIGLPPAPEEIEAFCANPSRAAFAAIVDQLLASPQFGERWARHWMDVARYAESAGSSRDVLMPHAWRYRDYVIDALNADVPYDRFVIEQIAGDLLPAETPAERERLQVATGFLAIGSKSLNGGNLELDVIDDQIDVIGKAMMGLTVSCARCHDHKFDPIPTADYYALAGIFQSTETFYGGGTARPKNVQDRLKVYLPLGPTGQRMAEELAAQTALNGKLQKQLKELAKAVKELQNKLPKDWKKQQHHLEAQAVETPKGEEAEQDPEVAAPAVTGTGAEDHQRLLAQVQELERKQQELRDVQQRLKELAEAAKNAPEVPFAVGVVDAKKPADSPIHVRGEKNKTGDVVPRGFLSCVTAVDSLPKIKADASGRLELAQWLTDPQHPLTARVAVNRLWQHLFGRGIVETADNFGNSGQPPTHPELLDHLAHRFVTVHRWSVKSMVRELVLTRTYQLSSAFDEHNSSVDPGNAYYWRMGRRRLEVEAMRDAMLAAGGELSLQRPKASAVAEIGEGEVGRGINMKPLYEPFPHRSVYLPIIRGLVPEMLKLFDFPEPSNPQGQRDATNVPAQALFLMNSPFVIEQSEVLAKRVLASKSDDQDRVKRAYLLVLSRGPTEEELGRGLEFLSRFSADLSTSDMDRDQRQLAAWTTFCQSLFACAEFRFLE